jgi:acetoacetate decarboxylase
VLGSDLLLVIVEIDEVAGEYVDRADGETDRLIVDDREIDEVVQGLFERCAIVIAMLPDSSGFGSYTESGMVIPCRFRGEDVNFVAQMYLDDDPPISAGREIWGFPKKYAHPKLEIVKDTLTGTLEYAGQLVAMGTMGYKHESMAGNGERTTATLSKTQVNLKLIPGVDGEPAICQLVAYNLTEIVVKGSWIGPGRLHLVPHVNAPVADLPVRRIVGAHHFLADLTLPYGRVIYDYLKES